MLKREIDTYNRRKNLKIINGSLSGFKRELEYFSEKCFYMLNLDLFDEKKCHLKHLTYNVGEYEIDENIVSLIKKNIDSILTKFSAFYEGTDAYYNNVPVKVVTLGDTVIALTDTQESMFLLINSITKKPLNKTEFMEHIDILRITDLCDLVNSFTEDVEAFTKFIRAENTDAIYQSNIKDLTEYVHELTSVLLTK